MGMVRKTMHFPLFRSPNLWHRIQTQLVRKFKHSLSKSSPVPSSSIWNLSLAHHLYSILAPNFSQNTANIIDLWRLGQRQAWIWSLTPLFLENAPFFGFDQSGWSPRCHQIPADAAVEVVDDDEAGGCLLGGWERMLRRTCQA